MIEVQDGLNYFENQSSISKKNENVNSQENANLIDVMVVSATEHLNVVKTSTFI